jgi:hypothetical protein
MHEAALWFAGVALGSMVIPSIGSFMIEGAWRERWRLEDSRPGELRVDGLGAFRDATVQAVLGRTSRDRAPRALRAMAFSCWFLAQMVIPGFLVWCVGVLMLGEMHGSPAGVVAMLSFFPGAACAWLVWRAGGALVRGERDRADRDTRSVVTYVGGYNVIVIVASAGWVALHRSDSWLLGCIAYATVSLLHALAVRAAFLAHRDGYPIERVEE